MVNILYLSHTGSAVGGGERQLIGLIKNLDRSLHNPVVICPDAGEFSARLEDLEIAVHVCHLPGWRKAISYPFRRSAVTRLIKLASEHGINLVHASDLWLNYYAWKVGQSLRIPIVSHVRNFLKSERVHKYLFDKFDRIIAISENVKEPLILAGLPLEKIRVIYDGVELSEYSSKGEKTNVLRQDYSLHRYLVGLVGRIEPFKRQKEFIQVIYEVLKFRQDVTFLFVGEPARNSSGYFREVQQAIQEYDIAEHIVFTGYRRDMPEVLSSLDLLVTLSGGSVMLEAMACEKPVVSASKADPAKLRIVRHNETGFVVPYDDIHSIAEAILRLLENEEMRSEMGKAGRERVEELFDMRGMAKLTEAVYEDLL